MWGFISKEDKKILQKVRENKNKDLETWKYMIGRESATMVSTMLLFAFSVSVMDYAEIINFPLSIKILAAISLVFGIINLVGMCIIFTKLTSEDKE